MRDLDGRNIWVIHLHIELASPLNGSNFLSIARIIDWLEKTKILPQKKFRSLLWFDIFMPHIVFLSDFPVDAFREHAERSMVSSWVAPSQYHLSGLGEVWATYMRRENFKSSNHAYIIDNNVHIWKDNELPFDCDLFFFPLYYVRAAGETFISVFLAVRKDCIAWFIYRRSTGKLLHFWK